MVGSFARPWVPRPVAAVALGAVAALVLLAEFGLYRLPLPQASRLVPQWVTRESAPGALQFGVEMGTGLRTYSPSGLPHLAAVALLLYPAVEVAVVTGAGFAVGRALMTVSRTASANPDAWDADLKRSMPAIKRTLVVSAAACLAVVLGIVPTLTVGG